MNDELDYDKLADAMLRAQDRRAAEAQEKAEADAKAAQEKWEAEAPARAEAERKAQAEADARAQAAKDRDDRIAGVLASETGDRFVDEDGAEHRVIGQSGGGVDTVSRDVDGGKIGKWRPRHDAASLAVLATWRRKV